MYENRPAIDYREVAHVEAARIVAASLRGHEVTSVTLNPDGTASTIVKLRHRQDLGFMAFAAIRARAQYRWETTSPAYLEEGEDLPDLPGMVMDQFGGPSSDGEAYLSALRDMREMASAVGRDGNTLAQTTEAICHQEIASMDLLICHQAERILAGTWTPPTEDELWPSVPSGVAP